MSLLLFRGWENKCIISLGLMQLNTVFVIFYPPKVASLKHQKHVTRKESKKAATHPRTCTERARRKASDENSDEEGSSGSEQEQRPPTPTESMSIHCT